MCSSRCLTKRKRSATSNRVKFAAKHLWRHQKIAETSGACARIGKRFMLRRRDARSCRRHLQQQTWMTFHNKAIIFFKEFGLIATWHHEAPRQRNPKQINVVPDSTKRDRKLRIAKTSSLRSQKIRQAIRNKTSVKNITQKTDLNAHVQTAYIARQRNSPFLMSRCGECSTRSVRLEVNTNTPWGLPHIYTIWVGTTTRTRWHPWRMGSLKVSLDGESATFEWLGTLPNQE